MTAPTTAPEWNPLVSWALVSAMTAPASAVAISPPVRAMALLNPEAVPRADNQPKPGLPSSTGRQHLPCPAQRPRRRARS